ncbi:Armadillo repeat-containing protein 7, variant 2 [Balamuthia mandrillaris]
MFSTEGQLRRRTGKYDAPRFEYLQALVTEFQDTTDAEAKRQVLANLANFAYDPINYDHFRKLNVLDLFLDVLSEPDNDQAVEFAMGGLCNCCLDPQFAAFILENDGVPLVAGCLGSANLETVLSAITTLYYLLTPSSLDRMFSSASLFSVLSRLLAPSLVLTFLVPLLSSFLSFASCFYASLPLAFLTDRKNIK